MYTRPIENHVFFDMEDDSVEMLQSIENDLNTFLNQFPPDWENSLAVVGYTGFRSARSLTLCGMHISSLL
jgi:hypothetical protein